MKRFRFDLDRVLDWRRQQLELEQIRLEALLAERRTLGEQAARCESERSELRRPVAARSTARAQDLAAAERYWLHLGGESKRRAEAVAGCDRRIGEQQARILEARRRLRLLERLEQRRRQEWQTAVDREQEALSAELFLSRRQQGPLH